MIINLDDIEDCKGYKIVKSVPWNVQEDKGAHLEESLPSIPQSGWGFIICSPPTSKKSDELLKAGKLYGVIGPIHSDHIHEKCLGFQLKEVNTLQNVLSSFVLACGLSIINRAKLELGDGVIVAGINALALNIMAAAKLQGATIACLISNIDVAQGRMKVISEVADVIVDFRAASPLDSKFDEFASLSRGKMSYVDAAGVPNEVSYMASRLKKFESLVLCRHDLSNTALIDVYRDIFRKSANILYWSRPENYAEALMLSGLQHRAQKMFYWNRLPRFMDIFDRNSIIAEWKAD